MAVGSGILGIAGFAAWRYNMGLSTLTLRAVQATRSKMLKRNHIDPSR